MGFKAFKNHFGIENHTVSVSDGVLCIGSGYVSRLVGFDMETGAILINDAFSGFLNKYYPEILKTTNEERLALIKVKDVFEQSIPVYTSQNGQIIEKECETLSFPNVTHDGELMYQNRHYANKADAIEYERKNLHSRIANYEESVADLEAKLAEKKGKLVEAKKLIENFNKTYP